MSYSIKLLPIAYKDLQQAKKWYNEKREHLGEEFKKAVIAEIDYIKEYPKHYQRKYKELRQSLITRFPYAIFLHDRRVKQKNHNFWRVAYQ